MARILNIFAIFQLVTLSMAGDQCEFSVDAAKESGIAISDLAIKLYQQIKKPDQNVIFSPVSVALALALVESGGMEGTRDEIQTLIGSQGQSDSSHLYLSLQRQLKIKGENSRLIVSIANGLFYSENLRLKANYFNKMKECFETELAQVPFSTNPEVARHQINQWVSNATQDKIPELLKEIDEETVAVLVNAIYMKADWMHKFYGSEDLPFYQSGKSDQAKSVHFMTREGNYGYSSLDDFSLVEIPYKEAPISMYIILPNQKDGLPQVEQSLSQLISLFRNTTHQRVSLKLPKFTIRQSVDLKHVLVNLGLKEMFSDNANFSRMTMDDVKISDAVHQAYIEVNENGTEAAAATAIEGTMRISLSLLPDPVPFVADHPFIFAIVHKPTWAIAFMGRINSIDKQE